MQKISSFSLADVVFDPQVVTKALDRTCRARAAAGPFRVSAVCQAGAQVCFVLLPATPGVPDEEIVIVPVADSTPAGFPGELFERWSHGFNALGVIDTGQGNWLAVYSHPRTTA